jgi:hypothetical protein
MQSSEDECDPMQRCHAHENKPHEDMHPGTAALADGLTVQKGTGPLRKVNMLFSCCTGGFGVRLYFREQESSRTSDDV